MAHVLGACSCFFPCFLGWLGSVGRLSWRVWSVNVSKKLPMTPTGCGRTCWDKYQRCISLGQACRSKTCGQWARKDGQTDRQRPTDTQPPFPILLPEIITKLISENIYLASLAEIYLLKHVFSASAVRHSCPARPVSVQTDTLAGLFVLLRLGIPFWQLC